MHAVCLHRSRWMHPHMHAHNGLQTRPPYTNSQTSTSHKLTNSGEIYSFPYSSIHTYPRSRYTHLNVTNPNLCICAYTYTYVHIQSEQRHTNMRMCKEGNTRAHIHTKVQDVAGMLLAAALFVHKKKCFVSSHYNHTRAIFIPWKKKHFSIHFERVHLKKIGQICFTRSMWMSPGQPSADDRICTCKKPH